MMSKVIFLFFIFESHPHAFNALSSLTPDQATTRPEDTHIPLSPYVLKNSMWLQAWIQPMVHVSLAATGGTSIRAFARKCGVR